MRMQKLTIAAIVLMALATAARAETYTKGVVESIDVKGNKLTIAHEELKDLDMPAMTMVFRVQETSLMDGLVEGANIEFVAERVDGKLTVTRIK